MAFQHYNQNMRIKNLTVIDDTGAASTRNIMDVTALPGPATLLGVAASGALVANTRYVIVEPGALTMTLPAAADSTKGDTILVDYALEGSGITNGATHKYGTAGEFFKANSTVHKSGVASGSVAADLADGTADDFLNLVGITESGPGDGTRILFTFDGSQWYVNARCEHSGAGAGSRSPTYTTRSQWIAQSTTVFGTS